MDAERGDRGAVGDHLASGQRVQVLAHYTAFNRTFRLLWSAVMSESVLSFPRFRG
jgi:hypothetical protein